MGKSFTGTKGTPELFAQNMRTLFVTFRIREFSQNDLALELGKDPGTLSRYISGVTASLKNQEEYADVARYMILKICCSAERTQKLCALTRLDSFDYTVLKSDKTVLDKASRQLERAMRDLDLATGQKPPDELGPLPVAEPKPSPRLPPRRMIAGAFVLIALAAAAFAVWMFRPPRVTLIITNYSQVGEQSPYVTGTVSVSRGDPCGYAVTLSLVSPENGHTYAPKPSHRQPSVEVTQTEHRGVGRFTCQFATGDHPDMYARELVVYVVPATFEPTEDIAETLRVSVAHQEIYREDPSEHKEA